MDISKWLHNVTDKAPPDPFDDRGVPDISRPRNDSLKTPQTAHGHKRRRASSDSSWIQPRRSFGHAQDSTRRQAISGPLSGASVKHHDGEQSKSSFRGRATSETRPNPYERRPRYKTKIDRYELKPRRQRKEADSSKRRRGTRRRRESRRLQDGERTTAVVQNFERNSRSKKGRLTLDPNINAGLFKHGRSGGQMTGHRNGLRDLVFNELRFLQKPTEREDEHLADMATNAAKSGRIQAQEEEISAYFGKGQTGNFEQIRDADLAREEVDKARRTPGIEDQNRGGCRNTAEVPVRDRTGEPHQLQDRDESADPYSWSESVPGRRSPVDRRRTSEQHGGDVVARQATTSKTTAQSLPANRLYHRLDEPHHVTEQGHHGRILEKPRESQVLSVEVPRRSPPHQPMCPRKSPNSNAGHDKENANPLSSMDDLLSRVRETVERPMLRYSTPYNVGGRSSHSRTERTRELAVPTPGHVPRPTRRVLGEIKNQKQTGESISVIQALPRQPPPKFNTIGLLPAHRTVRNHPNRHDSTADARNMGYMHAQDVWRSAYEPVMEDIPLRQGTIDTSFSQPDTALHEVLSISQCDTPEGLAEQGAISEQWRLTMETSVRSTPSIDSAPNHHGIPQMENLEAQNEATNEMAGFWRPNRLY